LEKERAKIPPNNPLTKKYTYEIQKLQAKIVRYYVILLDDTVVVPTVRLLDTLLFLLPKWLGFDYSSLRDGRL
jgi:hypothetical protein